MGRSMAESRKSITEQVQQQYTQLMVPMPVTPEPASNQSDLQHALQNFSQVIRNTATEYRQQEEHKGFGTGDIKVETSAQLTGGTEYHHLPPISGQLNRGQHFLECESSRTSKLADEDCTLVNEELGDSTVDQIKVLTEDRMLSSQRLEITMDVLDL